VFNIESNRAILTVLYHELFDYKQCKHCLNQVGKSTFDISPKRVLASILLLEGISKILGGKHSNCKVLLIFFDRKQQKKKNYLLYCMYWGEEGCRLLYPFEHGCASALRRFVSRTVFQRGD